MLCIFSNDMIGSIEDKLHYGSSIKKWTMWFEYAQELHTKRKEVWIAEIATVNSKFLNVTGVYINHRTPTNSKQSPALRQVREVC